MSDVLDERRSRLLDPPNPNELLKRTINEAADSASNRNTQLKWQKSDDCSGYSRIVAQVPLSEATFDQLFNGRSGYRAQYYLSPEEGILYNRDILTGFLPVIKHAYESDPLNVEFWLIEKSLCAPHSKIWLYDEQNAFDHAEENTLNPPRWVKQGATRGRKAPLPEHLMVDVKGAFIHPHSDALFIDELKLDRACDIHLRGYT